jgi:diguanylate cyclase (GGDEF)-like protein
MDIARIRGIPRQAAPANADVQPRVVSARDVEPVDPGYWPRAIGLRVVICATYFMMIPTGLTPMSFPWWMASGGGLLVYSLIMLAIYLHWPQKTWIHSDLTPYSDVLLVTLAIVAVAEPELPIWIGYVLIIMSLSALHTTKYLLAYSFFAMIMFWVAVDLSQLLGRAELNTQIATVASILFVFTAMNCDVIATSNRKLREMVLHASRTDPLTGLQNRRRFREVLDAHAGGERSLAVIMYDVDNFKSINEEKGHVHADGVLVAIAEELRRCFRDADAVARYGGDEIIVLAQVEAPDDAVVLAERSLERVWDAAAINLSAGVAVFPLCAPSLDETVRAADEALGRAKRSGKARVDVAPARTLAA